MNSTLASSFESLGHLFYFVHPSKSTFPTTDLVPHYISKATGWFLTLIIIERIILRKKGKSPTISDSLTSMSCGLFQEINHIALRGGHTALYVYLYDNYRIFGLPWDSTWTWIICALAMDFCYYWAHRACHEVNLFWAQHQVHHSSEEYNLTTALRLGMWQKWNFMFFYLPMAFFIPPSHFFVHSQLNLLYQFWIHTEVIDSLGPLEWILNTPSHHRVHHGSTRYCVDKNYAGVLIIWDRIFGTFEAERRDEQIVYGLIEAVDSYNPFYLQLFYFKKIYEKMCSVPGILNKFKVTFYGPGWVPGSPKLGYVDQLPETIVREKLNIHISPRQKLYAAIHFIILAEGYRQLAFSYKDMEGWMVHTCSAFLIISLISIGALLNQNLKFAKFESIRCFLFLVGRLYLPVGKGSSWFLYTITMFYLYSFIKNQLECLKKCPAINKHQRKQSLVVAQLSRVRFAQRLNSTQE